MRMELRAEEMRLDRAEELRMDRAEELRMDRAEELRMDRAEMRTLRAEEVRRDRAEELRMDRAEELRMDRAEMRTLRAEELRMGREGQVQMSIKACEAVQQGSFNGIALHGDRGQKVINPTKFYEALCQSMKERMVRSEEESLFTKINILNPETWPSPLPVMYGESELRELCDQTIWEVMN
ncbi:unnamed protein product [Arctogadus glacialis]